MNDIEELIKRYRKAIRRKKLLYCFTTDPRKRVELARDVEEAEQAIRLLQHMGKDVPENPEMGYHNKFETR